MARTKEKAAAFDPWAEYQRMQLTPEEKAASRKRLEEQSHDPAWDGVWELFLELEGKVHLDGARRLVRLLPRFTFHEGYWERAGLLRAMLLPLKIRAFVPDVLIARSCIDHDIRLITYDRDFRHFERAGLKLL